MAWHEKYMMLFLDWIEQTEELNAAEKGRLIDALVKYFRGDGDWAGVLKGNERFVFPVYRAQLDRQRAQREKASSNAKQRSKAKRSEGELKNNNNNNQNHDQDDYEYDPEYDPLIADDEEDNNRSSQQGIAGAIARVWQDNFGYAANPATARVLAYWMQFLGFDSEEFIEEAISNAAARNANDPVRYIIAMLKEWRVRGIRDVADLDC